MLRKIYVYERGKGDGSKRMPSEGTVSALAAENRGKPRTASVKTVSVPVKFRTDWRKNTSQTKHHYDNLIGVDSGNLENNYISFVGSSYFKSLFIKCKRGLALFW
jgi:hypothetical protein